MKNLLKYGFFIFLSVQFCSCGYTKTEDDKFPEMPEFPDHSNQKISLQPIGMKVGRLYKNKEGEMMGLVEILSQDHRYYNRRVMATLDENLTIIDSVAVSRNPYIENDGSFYVETSDNEIALYQNVSARPIIIPKHPFDGQAFKEDLEKQLNEKEEFVKNQIPDSLRYKLQDRNDSLSYYRAMDAFKERVLKDIKCVKQLNDARVLVYEDAEYLLNLLPYTNYEHHAQSKQEGYDLINECTKCPQETNVLSLDSDPIKMIDKAVVANGSSGGNHYSFGSFYTVGYEYYELEIDGQSTHFKNLGNYVGMKRITSRTIPGSSLIIVDRQGEYNDVTQTYMAKIEK